MNSLDLNGPDPMRENKPPYTVEWPDYLAISVIIWFLSFLNISIWAWLLGTIFDYTLPNERKIIFSTVLTAISMLKNFRVKENDNET